ncbi:hypothetical protein IMSAGC019_02966 [Lachnospiraceae bacterium]|nr:hypothetical protein IMSAGC019_02966 [Lachnospiraceae bacterium]
MDHFHIDIKKMLVSLLADVEVRNAIKSIFDTDNGCGSAISLEGNPILRPGECKKDAGYEELLDNKEKELRELKAQIENLEKEIAEKDEKARFMQNCLDSVEDEKNKLWEKLKPVKDFAEIWEELSGLEGDLRNYLGGLAGSNEMYAFMSLGRELSKVKQLGKYIRDIAVAGSTDENTIEVFNRYFCFCINVYNSASSGKQLSHIPVMIGEEYSSEKCTKTSSSSFNGRVEKVLVDGFKNNDVEFRPVVKTS